jgi:hypothetical protein
MLKLHLRTIPHFFDPVKQKGTVSPAEPPYLLCLLNPEDLNRELSELQELASAEWPPHLPTVWKILLPRLSPSLIQSVQSQLNQAKSFGPLLVLESLPVQQWASLVAGAVGCISFSRDLNSCQTQAAMALAMEKPFLLPEQETFDPFLSSLPLRYWPSARAERPRVLEECFLTPQFALRSALLKSLDLTRILSLQNLQATEMLIFLFWGRSGSVFLQSLFDRHPEILSTPSTVLMRFYEIWPQILKHLMQTKRSFELNDLLNVFIEAFPSLFYASPDQSNCHLDRLGPEQNTVLSVDSTAFKEAFTLLAQTFFPGDLEITSKTFILLLHYAYELAQGLDISEKHLIAYQLHRPYLNSATQGLFQDFPQARVLGMVREPIRGLYSHLRMFLEDTRAGQYQPPRPDYTYEDMVFDGSYLGYYQHQLMGWKALQTRYDPPLREVALENLHQNPENQMRQLAEWLGITWHSCLLESTFNGLAYWGDSRAHQKLQGFSQSHPLSQDWEDQFSFLDREVLSALLADDLKRQGYDAPFLFVKTLLPLLIFMPTRLEFKAFEKALKSRDQKACEDTLLNLLDRWKISFMALFGREI